MSAIKSKIHNYGHEHEADWPPRFPENPKGLVGYWDPETKTFKEGYPPNPNNQFGVAPIVMFDSMPKTYHQGACREVESRAEWERLDRECGTLTFGSINEPRKYVEKGSKAQDRELKKDRRRAAEEALKMVRANPREISQKWEKEAEKQKEVAKKSGLSKLLKDEGVKL